MCKRLYFIIFALLGISTINAQSSLAHEIGIMFGPVTFQSDYGERNNFDTNAGNTGFGIGIIHFLNFSSNNNKEHFFSEHFKVRTEFSFTKTNLHHFGKWVSKNPPTLGVQRLKAMSGSTSTINLGPQLEFSPFMKIHDYENSQGSLSPYVSLGFLVSYYSTKTKSGLGELGTIETTPLKYLTPSDGREHGYSNESNLVLSATAAAGIHYKLTRMSDLMLEARFQAFNSDWVDGLNPNKDIYKENKSNDWQVWFNAGYIYYLDF